jgi:trehalose 2-sulfotransferase
MVQPLSEQEVNGAEFDHQPCEVKRKLIVCSTPRSGSYLLCRAMISNGIGVPHEYFNGINASVISSRFGLDKVTSPELEVDGKERRAFIAALLDRRTVNGIFAAKIQGGQFHQYFKNSEDAELFQGAHFVYLYRQDLLSQAISFHISLLTGRWGRDETVTTAARNNPQFFDNNLIANRMNELAEQGKQWLLFFARNGISPLVFNYEAIKDDLAGALLKIVTTFALPISSREFSYAESGPETSSGGARLKSEIRAYFLRANSRISTMNSSIL